MTPERWQQIEEIFHEALELDPAARPKFIKKATDKDKELKAEVEKLLVQFDEASSFIEQPLYDSGKNALLSSLLDDSDEDPMVGSMLGNYRIDREIGRGGMGAVYEACRADGEFRLRVAVKVVKRGVDTDFVLRRFRNERQILAALDHPFITRLIDGGTTPDGRPYFVMDHIDGLPLYRHCDKKRHSVSLRLELFTRICEAVEYAHEKRVIHRDLKPSNIFVTDDGSPRLLDFGIAKLLDPALASDTLQPTATALRMMTIDYASPEQVRGEKVTYSTDIYSLGVILFELLTGHRPYALKSRSPHDVARAVCDDEPLLPSNAVSGVGGTVAAVPVNPAATTMAGVAERRRESRSDLSDQLRGNLDNIIMKALRKEPDQRYESVAAFRADIKRHLDGEAVSSPAYFATHKSDPAASVGDGSTLVAVLPLSMMGPAAAGSTDEAYLMVGLADAIITRLASVKKLTVRPTSSITRYNEHQINPFRAGVELGVDFVLDGRIRRFGERLRISLQLLDVKNGAAIWAGHFDEHLTDVLELEDAISEQVAAVLIPQLTGEEKQKLAKRGTNNAQAYEAYLRGRFYWNQFTSQSFPKALEAFERAIELDADYALAHVGIADFYIWANIYGLVPVRESYELANAAAVRALQIDDELGEAYASMGLVLLNQFEYEKAEEMFLKAIDLNPHYSLAHEWYSASLVGNGRFDEGLAEIRRAEDLDPLSLRSKTMVVWSLYQALEYETAVAKADEIINLDPHYPQGHLQRGNVLTEMGRADEAVASIEAGMRLMPGASLAQFNLCFALAAAGRQAEAVRLADEMKTRAKAEYVKPMFLSFASLAAGQIDDAFEYLTIAVDEHDPWLVWLGTEPKLAPIRTDPRYHELLKRARKTLVSGKVRLRPDTDPNAGISVGFDDAVTMPASEMPTLPFKPGFFRRHVVKLSAAAVLLIGIFAANQAGFLTVSITSDADRAARLASSGSSIAVLPFENRTSDTANDYLTDGLTENLINQLSTSPDIRTISRHAAFTYKGKQTDVRVIGRELGVENILRGSVRRQANEYMIHAELISVADGKSIFADDFVESADRVFALPVDIATRIIETVNVRNTQRAQTQHNYTENNEAFQLYLKGEFHRQKATPDDLRTSIGLYEQARDLDPGYALAYQGLALAYRSAPAYGILTPREAYAKAKDAAQTALSIDPSLSTPYVPLASIRATYDWDYTGAETAYKNAIQLGPNNAEAHFSYANFLVAMGRIDEALGEFRYSQQLDPLSLNVQTNIGWALYISGRYDEAAVHIRQVIARDPTFGRAYLNLGEILQEQGKYDESIVAVQKARSMAKDPLADMALGHVYGTAGRRKEALAIAATLEDEVRQGRVSPFLPGVVWAGLGDKDKAFYWLERAYQERSNWLTLIKVGRRLKTLHGDPRFDDLLKRVGF